MEIKDLYHSYQVKPVISTDSRHITPGCIFFALRGENFNGNQYASQAIQKGARLAIIDDDKYLTAHCLLVNDSLKTLQELAAYHARQLKIPLIALTGSNGKTTTKELIFSVLQEKYVVTATSGNLNNHIGVPLSVLGISEKTEIGLIEMGANHRGEIAFLSEIANPCFGLITNVGKAHLEGFGSFEGVVEAKTELYQFLKKKGGKVFINGGNTILMEKAKKMELSMIEYGKSVHSAVQGEILESTPYLKVALKWKDYPTEKLFANTNLVGNYNLENIEAAACIGHYFGLTPRQIIAGIEKYHPKNLRSQYISTGKNELILDTYNANPTSMYHALQNFHHMKHPSKVAIIGEMFELGKDSNKEHLRLIREIQNLNIDKVFYVGKMFDEINKGENIFRDVEAFKQYVSENPLKDSLILIKGSRLVGLEKCVEVL